MAKQRSGLAYFLYFFLVALLLVFLMLHAFGIVPMETGFFTRFLISLIFVLLVLPLVAHIKFFDVIDIKRDTKLLAKNSGKYGSQLKNKR